MQITDNTQSGDIEQKSLLQEELVGKNADVSSKKDKKRKQSKEHSDKKEKRHKKSDKDHEHKKGKRHKSEDTVEKSDRKAEKVEKKSGEPRDYTQWLKENRIKIEDPKGHEWTPILSFAELTSVPERLKAITKKFTKPTPIQSATWPILLKGDRDVIGIAETGSGKTLSFALPGLVHYEQKSAATNGSGKRKPCILVLAPTRELASQIHEQFIEAAKGTGARAVCIYGGCPKDAQRSELKRGVDVVVGCPGRILDLMEEGSCLLDQVSYVALDEADRMLDLGFEKEVRKIIKAANSARRVVMFSATWPTSIQDLASEFLSSAVKVTVGSEDLSANGNIRQIVEVIDPYEKEKRLLQLLNEYHGKTRKNRVLVFCLYKKEAARVEQFLQRNRWNCIAIHGDMKQNERNQSFYAFKNGEIPLLIATDVAARGLDIPDVEYVINFTFPLTIEDYVHRIGRTGRAGRKGVSHTLFTQHDKARSGELVNLLKQMNQEVPQDLIRFGTTVKRKEHSVYGAFYKEIDKTVAPTKIVFDSDDE